MRSVGRVVVCSNETCHLSQRGNESVVNPAERRVITLNPVQNSDAIRWALEPLSSMKVLHFETMDGAFGGFAPLGKWCVQDALKGEPGVDVQCT